MIRAVRVWSLVALCLSTFFASSHADNLASLFDGAGAATPMTAIKFTLSAKRSNADLFYFTPQEAALAAQRFAITARLPRALGYTFDPDVPAEIQAQIRQDLSFIAGILAQTASPLHREIFGPVNGPAYIQFFENRITAIGMHDCGGGNAVACVIPFIDPSKMWLTENFSRFSHPQIARMMIVFHEARHTEMENGNWMHATCPSPFRDKNGKEIKSIWTGAPLAGEPACDSTPLGSYGSSTIMLKNVSKFCANCTDKVKMDAGLYADDQLNRITNASARKRMEDDLY